MTPDEAIKKFEKIKKGNIYLIHQRIEGKEVFDDYSLCDMAISALEKQIPMKIRIEREHPIYGYASFCPNCNRMDVGAWSYCPDCGQNITMG